MFPLFSSISNFLKFLIVGLRREPLIRTLPPSCSSSSLLFCVTKIKKRFFYPGCLFTLLPALSRLSSVLKRRKLDSIAVSLFTNRETAMLSNVSGWLGHFMFVMYARSVIALNLYCRMMLSRL